MSAAKWKESTALHDRLTAQIKKQEREAKEKQLRLEARKNLGLEKKSPLRNVHP